MRAPDFWTRDDALSRLMSAALVPVGALYNATVRWKAKHAQPYRAPVPVICVGNISAGGVGKTPVAVAVADAIIARGKSPFFLTRGYGGRLPGPLVVNSEHNAFDVGDEPLILARKSPTVVSRDRHAGAKLAAERGADMIVMDDGHQNFVLAKDLSIVVVDAEKGFGNGRVLPAGPLRETARQGLARADAVILMGDGHPELPGFNGTILRAGVEPCPDRDWRGERVIAFAGIGRPEKFFRTVETLGAKPVDAVAFPDHHPFTRDDIAGLRTKAREQGAQLLTTEKDYVRLSPEDRLDVAVLPILAHIEPAGILDRLLDSLVASR